jgi:hypothetical protein
MTRNRKKKEPLRLLKRMKITSGTEMAMPKEIDVVVEVRKDDEDGK